MAKRPTTAAHANGATLGLGARLWRTAGMLGEVTQ